VIVVRLAQFNIKRIVRHRGLRWVLALLPVTVALARSLFAQNKSLLVATELCPLACALLVAAALYAQWTVDCVSGLSTGLRASPISRRGLALSRVLSGVCILAAQMAVFAAILAIRF